jgi:hypothetical protein
MRRPEFTAGLGSAFVHTTALGLVKLTATGRGAKPFKRAEIRRQNRSERADLISGSALPPKQRQVLVLASFPWWRGRVAAGRVHAAGECTGGWPAQWRFEPGLCQSDCGGPRGTTAAGLRRGPECEGRQIAGRRMGSVRWEWRKSVLTIGRIAPR